MKLKKIVKSSIGIFVLFTSVFSFSCKMNGSDDKTKNGYGLFSNSENTFGTSKSTEEYKFLIRGMNNIRLKIESSQVTASLKEDGEGSFSLADIPLWVKSGSFDFRKVAKIKFQIKSDSVKSGDIKMLVYSGNDVVKESNLKANIKISDWVSFSISVGSPAQINNITRAFTLKICGDSAKKDSSIQVREIAFLDKDGRDVDITNLLSKNTGGSEDSGGNDNNGSQNGGNTGGHTIDTVVKGATDGKSVGTSKKNLTGSGEGDYKTLVWSDEFEGDLVKSENWTFETGAWGWGNQELQNYTNGANATVHGGVLDIIVKPDLTSTRMKTDGKKIIKYGRIEARIKASSEVGSWPAFWMLGANQTSVGWPSCGEIDIMEHANKDNFVYNTLHWNVKSDTNNSGYQHAEYGTANGNWDSVINSNPINVNEWHVYRVDWTDSSMDFYVDDIQTMAFTITDNPGIKAFKKDFFLILNFAAGGNFVKNKNKSTFTNLPWHMYVDYVRVYQ